MSAFAKEHGMKLVIHSDAQAFPPLPEQWSRFAHAGLVVAPHGAGLINLLAVERWTPLVEFVDVEYEA